MILISDRVSINPTFAFDAIYLLRSEFAVHPFDRRYRLSAAKPAKVQYDAAQKKPIEELLTDGFRSVI